jgi:Flp pilus assembly secretin CpaC
MRKASTIALGLACGLMAAIPSTFAIENVSSLVVVSLDQARIVKVPERTQTLVIGNPLVADVTLLKNNGAMVVTGKGFGETNLIALDAGGEPVAESTIRVNGDSKNVVVQRGMERESYSCAPRCQPAVALGDSAKYMGEVAGQIKAREGLGKSK